MSWSRRAFLNAGVATVAATGNFWVSEDAGARSAGDPKVFNELDAFIERYLRAMNAPGMTLVLADANGTRRVATYGFGDLARREPVRAGELFQIGSISKSFVALALMQLCDEGRLDLHKPVIEYLPWLRIASAYAPITTHHLLTHSAGLPDALEVILADRQDSHPVAWPPGAHFWYSNLGYSILGYLAAKLDGRALPEVIRERVFKPLSMNASTPFIDYSMIAREVRSYAPLLADRPYPVDGALREAPSLVVTDAAGCIASTAQDMGRYLAMLINAGRGPTAPLVSAASFERFATPHIRAADFGPTASYGYGIAVDKLDEATVLRHTGGMVSFMSSILVDTTNGVGCFASINAQQGYRPVPVTEYAVRLLRGEKSKPPAAPALVAPQEIEDAQDYTGTFKGEKASLQFVADGRRLFLVDADRRIPLARAGAANQFHVLDPAFDRFVMVFGRANPNGATPKEQGAVVEASWGGDWFVNAAYRGPRSFDVPAVWQSYAGHYRNDNPWLGSLRIIILKNRLTIDAMTPIEADGPLFRLRDEPVNTSWLRFEELVDGQCLRLKYNGSDFWRVPVP